MASLQTQKCRVTPQLPVDVKGVDADSSQGTLVVTNSHNQVISSLSMSLLIRGSGSHVFQPFVLANFLENPHILVSRS